MRDRIAPVGSWWLGTTARELRDTAALRVDGARVSFGELASSSEDVAAALAGAGVTRGDRVALLASASRRAVELVHATQRLDATLVPLNPRLTVSEIAPLIAMTRPRVVVTDDALVDGGQLERGRCNGVRALRSRALAARARLESTVAVDPDAPHSLLCTSGTTGAPKVVVLSHANHHASAVAAGGRLDYRARPELALRAAAPPRRRLGGLAPRGDRWSRSRAACRIRGESTTASTSGRRDRARLSGTDSALSTATGARRR